MHFFFIYKNDLPTWVLHLTNFGDILKKTISEGHLISIFESLRHASIYITRRMWPTLRQRICESFTRA